MRLDSVARAVVRVIEAQPDPEASARGQPQDESAQSPPPPPEGVSSFTLLARKSEALRRHFDPGRPGEAPSARRSPRR